MPNTYICSLCGWSCNNNDDLVQHLIIHANHRRQMRGWTNRNLTVATPSSLYATDPIRLEIPHSTIRYWNDIQQATTFGVPTTTYTQYTERPNSTTTTVSTVNSSLGAAVVTTTQSTASPITTTTVSQASGTFTCNYNPERAYNNKCAICLETLIGSAETKTTPCNHIFHKRCLLRLSATVLHSNTISFPCPLCRQAISHSWLDSSVD